MSVPIPLKPINGFSKGDDIFFVCRDSWGRNIVKISDFEWFFYVEGRFWNHLIENRDFLQSFKSQFSIRRITLERPYAKVYVPYTTCWTVNYKNSRRILELNENGALFYIQCLGYKTYEADVDPLKRLMIEKDDFEISDSYRPLFIDIETDDRGEEIVVGQRQIVSIAGFSNPNEYFVECYDDEATILRNALKQFKKYDVFLGWNSDSFDLPYIRQRLKFWRETQGIDIERELNFDWNHFIQVDLMWRFKHVYQSNTVLTSFSLERVAEHFKVTHKLDLGNHKIWDLFTGTSDDREFLKKYNLNDCRILYELEENLGIFNQMIAEARYCRTFLSRFYITELLDNLFLRAAKKRRMHLETRVFEPEKFESYQGGFVLDPKPGFYTNIHIFDFKSLYPNIIQTWNISPEIMQKSSSPDCIKGARSGIYFPSQPIGLLPGVIAGLLGERQKLKDEKERLLKEGKKDSTEYQVCSRDEIIIKELSNCLHPDTPLTIKIGDEIKIESISKIFERVNAGESIEIESFDFNTKKTFFKKIVRCVRKLFEDDLILIRGYDFGSFLCTPKHRLFTADFSSGMKKVEYRSTWKSFNSEVLKSKSLKPASELKTSDVLIGPIFSPPLKKTRRFLDLRSHIFKIPYRTPPPYGGLKFDVYRNKARKRGGKRILENLVKTSNPRFDQILSSWKKKGHKDSRTKLYRYIFPLTPELEREILKLSITDLRNLKLTFFFGLARVRIPAILDLTENLCWALGLYMAEGMSSIANHKYTSTKYDGCGLANTNTLFLEKAFDAFRGAGWHSRIFYPKKSIKTNGCGSVQIRSLMMSFLFRDWFGDGAINKKIPSFIFDLPISHKKQFIDGYFCGDGNIVKNGQRFTTISRDLAFGLQFLIRSYSSSPILIHTEWGGVPDYRLGRSIVGECYRIIHYSGINKNHYEIPALRFREKNQGYTFYRIKDLQEIKYSGFVYDIEVEDTHNFTIGNILSHNSVYGIAGNDRSRFYSIDLAESITLAGQYLIKYARDFFESLGFIVCAGDTDSVMVQLPEGSEPQAILDRFHRTLDPHLKETFNVKQCTIEFKHEKKFSRFINILKKNYVGRLIEVEGKPTDEIYAKGLELVKKDTIEYTRKLLKELLKYLLQEDHDLNFYISFIEKCRDDIHTRIFSKEEICITRRVSKKFKDYKSRPAHVRLAEKMWSNGNKEFFIGMDLQFIIFDSKDKDNKAIYVDDYNGLFDREFYWEKSVWPPLRRILSVVFPQHNWIQYDESKIKRPRKKAIRKSSKKELKSKSPSEVSNDLVFQDSQNLLQEKINAESGVG